MGVTTTFILKTDRGEQMKNVIITEWQIEQTEAFIWNVSKHNVKDCLGCWSCWIRTPGHCIQSDLDDFYRAFFQADQAIFYIEPVLDFISGNVKALLDRMIVCGLPYITYETDESRHVPRYEHMPTWVVYYKDTFSTPNAKASFIAYFKTVAHQFSTEVSLCSIE